MNSMLFNEVYDWLISLPSEEDVAFYIRSLDDDQITKIAEIQLRLAEKLYYDKSSYYELNNLQEILAILTPSEELVFLSYAAEFNSNSVIAKYIEKYPRLQSIVPPPTFSNWANTFCQQWSILSYFRAYPEYLQQVRLLHSLDEMHMSVETLKRLVNDLQKEFDNDKDRAFKGIDITVPEKEVLKSLLSQFAFLPPTYIEDLLSLDGLEKKNIFFRRVINCISILTTQAGTIADKEEVLLEGLRIAEEEQMLKRFKELYLDEFTDAPMVSYLTKFFKMVWNREKILSGESLELLKNYKGQLNQGQLKAFTQQLYASMESDLTLEVLMEPIQLPYLVRRLQYISTNEELATFITEMTDLVDYDQEGVVGAIINLYYSISKIYPR